MKGVVMSFSSRALKAKGEAYGTPHAKSSQKILAAMKAMLDVMVSELANATGLSVVGVKENIRKLKDANLVHRVGSDTGGHWVNTNHRIYINAVVQLF